MPGEDGKGIGLARVYTLDDVNWRRDAKVEKLRMEEGKKKDKKDKAAAKKLGKKAAHKTISKKNSRCSSERLGGTPLDSTFAQANLVEKSTSMVLRTPQLRRVTFREDEISGSMIELSNNDDSFSNEEEEQNSLEDSDSGFEINDFSVVLPFRNGIPSSYRKPPTLEEITISSPPPTTHAEPRHPSLLVTLKIPSLSPKADRNIEAPDLSKASALYVTEKVPSGEIACAPFSSRGRIRQPEKFGNHEYLLNLYFSSVIGTAILRPVEFFKLKE